jgi:hypothetical protein
MFGHKTPNKECSRPAQENVMNAHGETRLFLVVVNQPKTTLQVQLPKMRRE